MAHPSRKAGHLRKMAGLIPKTPQDLELAAELISSGVLTNKQVARVLQRQGRYFTEDDIYNLKRSRHIIPFRPYGELERSKKLENIKKFKAMGLEQQIERIGQFQGILQNLEKKLSQAGSPDEKKSLVFDIRTLKTWIKFFSKYLPEQSKKDLRAKGIIL